jgi:hypothetical protein
MPQFRLSTSAGTVLREWEAGDVRAAEDEATGEVTRHRMTDPPATTEYRLEQERAGSWLTVSHWGALAP